jgi:hypothetical protein
MNLFYKNKKILTIRTSLKTIILIFILVFILFTIPVSACHTSTFEKDFSTPKTTFFQGETVYASGIFTHIANIKLRIRDENGTVVFSSKPVYGKKITCSYNLGNNVSIGEWNIQMGEFNGGSWNWEWTSNFNVVAKSKCILTIKTDNNGAVIKVPDQKKYNFGTLVILKAIPNAGCKFDCWSGDLLDNKISTIINMTGNNTVFVHFKKINVPKLYFF